jgi:hypothetical protein
MTDIEIAKTELYEENLTLAIVKNGSLLYCTKSHGLCGFLEAVEKCGANLEGASVADRVAGKALALLCVHAKVKEVYAVVVSRKAQELFKQHRIGCRWNQIVETLLDADRKGVCRFEKAVAQISAPQQAYKTLRGMVEKAKELQDADEDF